MAKIKGEKWQKMKEIKIELGRESEEDEKAKRNNYGQNIDIIV